MANIVLSFNKPQQAAKDVDGKSVILEVYRDIDTDSGRNISAEIGYAMPVLSDYVLFVHTELSCNRNSAESAEYDLSTELICCPEGQQISESNIDQVIRGLAVTLSAGYDELYLLWERYYAPYKYRVSKLINVKAVQNSLQQIFSWIPGERVINPEFGSTLQKYLYEGITEQNIEAIMAEIRHCVSIWEPRVTIDRVVNVQTVDDTENNTVQLDVYYHIKGLDDEQYKYSYVYDRVQD